MKNFIVFLCVILSFMTCNAKSFKPPCSPRPEGLDAMVAKCFKEHVDLNSFIDYADDPDTDIDSLNNFKACTLRELGFRYVLFILILSCGSQNLLKKRKKRKNKLVDGQIAFEKIEAYINKWILNEESAKNINEFLKTAVEEANKEYGESAIAHKFFVIVNREESRASFITGEFCA